MRSLSRRTASLFLALPNQIEFTSSDDGVGVDRVEISYDGKNWSPAGRAIDLTQWRSQSKRTIFFRAVDRLGNREQKTQSINVVLRTEGPKVDLSLLNKRISPEVPLSQIRGGRLPAAQRVQQAEPARQERAPVVEQGPPRPGADG